jgi:protein-S-isoprenylcysteine O-methyltransferase Ste14
MFTIVLQTLSWLAFLAATIALGAWLRRNPGKRNAEVTSRILHFLFWFGVIPPAGLGFLVPGLMGFDEVLGLPSLPLLPVVRPAGALGLLLGLVLILVSNVALLRLGEGTNAFWLTQRLVAGDIYQWTRNPMSLGLYLAAVGLGLLAGSTTLTLGALFVVIPVHVFYLKTFEELELELRLGMSYVEYRRRVPFLLPRLGPRRG